MNDQFFDLRGLATYSSLSVRTLRSHLAKIPHYRIGGKLLVKKSEFDKYLEKHREADDLCEMVKDIMSKITTSN